MPKTLEERINEQVEADVKRLREDIESYLCGYPCEQGEANVKSTNLSNLSIQVNEHTVVSASQLLGAIAEAITRNKRDSLQDKMSKAIFETIMSLTNDNGGKK